MRVLITGGSGYLAWELIRQMKLKSNFEIVAASSDPSKIKGDSNYVGIQLIGNEMIWKDDDLMKTIDVIIHTAFCRKSDGEQLMRSLLFSKKLFERAVSCRVSAIINASSQSIFGSEKEELPSEDESYAPGDMYALSKWASELLLETIAEKSKTSHTSVRFASLMGPSKNVPVNVLYKFVQNALSGKDISIQGGKQNFSFLDVRDAADAIIRLLGIPFTEWKKAYNLGPQKQTNIKDLAQMVSDYAAKYGKMAVHIHLKEDDTQLNAGMNSRRLYETISWEPRFGIEDTIAATGERIFNSRGSGRYRYDED